MAAVREMKLQRVHGGLGGNVVLGEQAKSGKEIGILDRLKEKGRA